MATSEQNIEILLLAKKGDKAAFSQLVDLYSGRLYGYLYRLSGSRDDANDLLSELFLKVYEKIGSCRAETFDAWIFKMASNLFMDSLRAKKRREKLFEKMQRDFKDQPEQDRNSDFLNDKLTRNLRKLDSQTSELLTLRYYSQLSFEQLAKMRNEPIGTVLSKVHRGLKKLKELMEQSND